MIMICQNCGSPISIQSNFCGYCGSDLSSYEIWNNVTKKIVPKIENTYKIGVVQAQKTISFAIKNTGTVVIGIHVEQDTKKANTMSFLRIDDQKMLQQTINILPGAQETVEIDVHEEVLESILRSLEYKKQQNNIYVRLVVYTSLYDSIKTDFETFQIDFRKHR